MDTEKMMLFDSGDMVKIGCNECSGCSECCRGMGQSVILDPYDLYLLEKNGGKGFSELMRDKIELHVENSLILPSLKMQPETDACGFLNEKGRCSIHAYRPGLCRLFPLGRKYENDSLRYFILEDACTAKNRTKLKIKKWLEIPELGKYEQFLVRWYELRRKLMKAIQEKQSDAFTQQINVRMLQIFYEQPYDRDSDFYSQFEERMAAISALMCS